MGLLGSNKSIQIFPSPSIKLEFCVVTHVEEKEKCRLIPPTVEINLYFDSDVRRRCFYSSPDAPWHLQSHDRHQDATGNGIFAVLRLDSSCLVSSIRRWCLIKLSPSALGSCLVALRSSILTDFREEEARCLRR